MSDIGVNNSGPMSQALALSQPQLQALWEAQQNSGSRPMRRLKRSSIKAVAQGIVGANMKSVNETILDVLMAIGKVLAADIPDAFSRLPGAANNAEKGIDDAFTELNPCIRVDVDDPNGWLDPGVGDRHTFRLPPHWDSERVPALAAGGIVRPRRGGTVVRVGEAGRAEAIVPLPSSGVRSGAVSKIVIEADGRSLAETLAPYLPGESQRSGCCRWRGTLPASKAFKADAH